MTAILGQIFAMKELTTPLHGDYIKDWGFTEEIEKISKKHANDECKFFNALLDSHKSIEMEYDSLCALIFYEYTFDLHDKRCEAQLVAGLIMAELQEMIYATYLNVPAKIKKFQADQEVFKKLLGKRNFRFKNSQKIETEPDFKLFNEFSTIIREHHVFFNNPKLITLRIKKIISLMFIEFQNLQAAIDGPFNTPLAYLSWVFFMPRLCINLIILGRHLIPSPWMTEEERNLTIQRRLMLQIQRRGFEIANDLAWATVGLVNCFFLVGKLTPIGAYVNAAFFAYDIILAAVRGYLEINRLQRLKEDSLKGFAALADSKEAIENAQNYLNFLNEKINVEMAKLQLALTTTILLLLAVSIGLPCFTVAGPALSIISAVLLLTITIGNYAASRNLAEKLPVVKLEDLLEEDFDDAFTYRDELLLN